jgi:hypothetical protein
MIEGFSLRLEIDTLLLMLLFHIVLEIQVRAIRQEKEIHIRRGKSTFTNDLILYKENPPN